MQIMVSSWVFSRVFCCLCGVIFLLKCKISKKVGYEKLKISNLPRFRMKEYRQHINVQVLNKYKAQSN